MFQTRLARSVALITSVIATVLASTLTPAAALAMADIAATGVSIATDTERGVELGWSVSGDGAWTAETARDLLPTQLYGGYELPLQTYTLLLQDDHVLRIEVQDLDSSPLVGTLAPAPRDLPPALDWEPDPNLVEATPQLPSAPVFVVRQGLLHGLPIAVVAVSPIFEKNGEVRVATAFKALAADASLFDAATADKRTVAAGRSLRTEAVDVPVNNDALQSAYKLVVTQAGMHQVTFAELGGVSNPGSLRLTHNGNEVALEIASDRLRFYATAPGDRWNSADTYWLTMVSGTHERIGQADAAASAQQGTAYTRGAWVRNKIYDSVYEGPDGDHWFNADMRTDSNMNPTAAPTATVNAPSVLPLIDTTGMFSIGVTAWVRPPDASCLANVASYRLRVKLGSDEEQIAWNPAPGCLLQKNWTLPVTMTGTSQNLLLTMIPTTHPLGVKLDHVTWQRPVRLDFGGQNADFWTDAGAWSYTWSSLPGRSFGVLLPLVLGGAGSVRESSASSNATSMPEVQEVATTPAALNADSWRLYDVTNPNRPVIVPAGATGFNQGQSSVPRHYAMVDVRTLPQPAVIVHNPVDFGNVSAANAIYIGPAQFADELQPLIELRRAQGYTPLFVDIAAINDVYGFGAVSAPAIRNFLRNRTDWQNANRQISVVLVGDGTFDPHGYQGVINDNLVTPFMAEVDPFIRETACDQCFAQLNGDDPITGDDRYNNNKQVAFFSADIWLGRFPVRNEGELVTVVEKLVTYETQGSVYDDWRKHHVFLADNYILELDGNQNAKLDEAGDFGKITDAIAALLPRGSQSSRVYYDPAPNRVVRTNYLGNPVPAPGAPGYYITDAQGADPWRIADSDGAHNAVLSELGKGAGLVVYNGHSNHFQYARTYTGPENRINYLLNTISAGFTLANPDKYFIMLAMTCYTSSFATPTGYGVLDEVLFRRPAGGAVAVWGPSGLTVVHGHDRLQTGFLQRLWAGETGATPLGALTEAGYQELLTVAPANLDAAMTFLLTGDPLTNARISVQTYTYMPLVNR